MFKPLILYALLNLYTVTAQAVDCASVTTTAANFSNIQGTDSCFTAYWEYDAADTSSTSTINAFNGWYKNSKFKDKSPKFSNAYFLKGPVTQKFSMNSEGMLQALRVPGDSDPHTLIELSAENAKDIAKYGWYDRYRTMGLGIPYQFEIDVRANGTNWTSNVSWVVVMQAHAMAGIFNIGKDFNPPFALVISRGRWEAHIRADSRSNLPSDRSYARKNRYDLGAVTPGVWTRFIIRVIWGYENTPLKPSGGLVIARDGNTLHSEFGSPTFYKVTGSNGQYLGPYITVGAYTPLEETLSKSISVSVMRLRMKTLTALTNS